MLNGLIRVSISALLRSLVFLFFMPTFIPCHAQDDLQHLYPARKLGYDQYEPEIYSYILNGDTKKAVKALEKKYKASRRIKDSDAAYLLAHYYLFGQFDLYALGIEETPFDYKRSRVVNEKKGLKYLNDASLWYASFLYANRDCKYYDPNKAFLCMIQAAISNETDSIIGLFLRQHLDLEIDLRTIALSFYDKGLYVQKQKRDCKVWRYLNYLDAICRVRNLMPENHISAIKNLKNRTPSEFFAAGLGEAKSSNYKLAIFYIRSAAVSGNYDAFPATVDIYSGLVADRLDMLDLSPLDKERWFTGEMYSFVCHDKTFERLYPEQQKNIREYWWDKNTEAFELIEAKKKAKKQARRQFWTNILASIGQGMVMATQATANAMGYPAAAPYSNISSYNYLLNPNYAIMQINYQNTVNGAVSQAMYDNAASMANSYMNSVATDFNAQWSNVQFAIPDNWSTINWNETYNCLPASPSYGSQMENVDIEKTSTAGYSSQSASKSSTCSYCRGTGRVVYETYNGTYGEDQKKYCFECGQYFMMSTGHSHITCPVCRGR